MRKCNYANHMARLGLDFFFSCSSVNYLLAMGLALEYFLPCDGNYLASEYAAQNPLSREFFSKSKTTIILNIAARY
jgi:hypothetical protein